MLFGGASAEEKIVKVVNSIINRQHNIVYGVALGSIAKGVQRYDSDYDTKFFWWDDEKSPVVDHSHICMQWKEKAYRHIPSDTKEHTLFYDKIAFWDMRNLLGCLVNPSMPSRGISPELYYQILYSFSSPYQWDPYGLTGKIFPLIWDIYDIGYLIEYYKRNIEKYYQKKDGMISLRDYIYVTHAILSMKWVYEKKSPPPIYLKSLLLLCDNSISNIIIKLYEDLVSQAYFELKNGMKYRRKYSKYFMIEPVPEIDDFVNKEYKRILMEFNQKKQPLKEGKELFEKQILTVNYIYKIIESSLHENAVKDIM